MKMICYKGEFYPFGKGIEIRVDEQMKDYYWEWDNNFLGYKCNSKTKHILLSMMKD